MDPHVDENSPRVDSDPTAGREKTWDKRADDPIVRGGVVDELDPNRKERRGSIWRLTWGSKGGAKLSADSYFPASVFYQNPNYSSKILYVSIIASNLSLAKNNHFCGQILKIEFWIITSDLGSVIC